MNFKNGWSIGNQSQLSEQNIVLSNLVSNLKYELENTKSELNTLAAKFQNSNSVVTDNSQTSFKVN